LKIRIRNELILLNLVVLVLIIAIILFPSNGLRIALGIPFLLFFPGYTLMVAMFPRRERMDALEKTALSFGFSIAVVPLIGLILNYTPWGVNVEPVLYSVSAFILATSTIAWLRRRGLPDQEWFGIEFQLGLPGLGTTMRHKVLSIILLITIFGVLGTLGYVITTPRMGDKFTEFYILGEAGEATDYPLALKVGEAGKVVVGIINREYQDVSYSIEIRLSGIVTEKLGPWTLEHEQKREEMVNFVPDRAGNNRKVEFLLYKNGDAEPTSSPLYLWIDVTD